MKNRLTPARAGAALLLIAAMLPAAAMTVVASSASAPPRNIAKPTPVSQRALRHTASLDLVSGTIGNIDVAKKSLIVSGVALTWSTARLHVFRKGQRASEHDLRAGQAVRFAVEPGVSDSHNVVLVYIEGS